MFLLLFVLFEKERYLSSLWKIWNFL